MAGGWMAIRVELVSGHGEDFWPRPGRIFAAHREHTFLQLAEAIDAAFGRWDLSHLHLFTMADGTHVSTVAPWDGQEPPGTADSATGKLARLSAGEQFAYTFDMGDDWTHLCTTQTDELDPLDQLGCVPDRPQPFWGWGVLPDQYGRRFDGDDGEKPLPRRPAHPLTDLPPLLPWWGNAPR